ncbi:hypothetical protein OF83DRAFT_827235 [Amylostereum chailletii]|nr:hypothetical protein OF83DRAFT_827235 [Amylostereum chailletii]
MDVVACLVLVLPAHSVSGNGDSGRTGGARSWRRTPRGRCSRPSDASRLPPPTCSKQVILSGATTARCESTRSLPTSIITPLLRLIGCRPLSKPITSYIALCPSRARGALSPQSKQKRSIEGWVLIGSGRGCVSGGRGREKRRGGGSVGMSGSGRRRAGRRTGWRGRCDGRR